MTDLLFLRDAQLRTCEAVVTDVDAEAGAVCVDRSVCYPTGGGQPHDTGTLTWGDTSARISDVTKRGDEVWLTLEGPLPAEGTDVTMHVDWERRHQLMRTHTAMHILCGVIWNEWGRPVTGGNMEPLKGRMDFEFDPLPDGFAQRVEALVNTEIAADRRVEVSFLERAEAVLDEDLIRTKVNLIPESVSQIRVVDIVGLDRQADGGTHVTRTGEVGTFRVIKTESKGRGNKRLRVELSG